MKVRIQKKESEKQAGHGSHSPYDQKRLHKFHARLQKNRAGKRNRVQSRMRSATKMKVPDVSFKDRTGYCYLDPNGNVPACPHGNYFSLDNLLHEVR